ncbi:jg23613 [Pararge aegeria aegeria]|uniref:Jg23613 protein n=1 Tax=Pararge aegeria aegeria TaxID=348720 RepID=A0A8S4SHZ9_9NEOP|nr:jg23613 [Pararge aegeria aegeria]
MADPRVLFILPLVLILATATQAELQCYKCQDCEAIEKYEKTAQACTVKIPSTVTPIQSASLVNGLPPSNNNQQESPRKQSQRDTLPSNNNRQESSREQSQRDTLPSNNNQQESPREQSQRDTLPSNNNQQESPREQSQPSPTNKLSNEPPKSSAMLIARCVRVEYKVGGVTKVDRGCSIEETSAKNETICNTIMKDKTSNQTSCIICDKDKCNSAGNLVVGLLPLIMSLLLIKGKLDNADILGQMNLCAPDRFAWRRRRLPLLAVPRGPTNMLNKAPLTRAICSLNDIAERTDLFCTLT